MKTERTVKELKVELQNTQKQIKLLEIKLHRDFDVSLIVKINELVRKIERLNNEVLEKKEFFTTKGYIRV